MSGWWHRASTEQRLAQLDGGIELGMTGRQIAMASGAKSVKALLRFGNFHGRRFAGRTSSAADRPKAKQSAEAAYFRGEAVDLWREGPRDCYRHQDEVEEIVLE